MDFERAVEHLPEGAKTVFVLYDVEGYQHEEIATILGSHPGLESATAPGAYDPAPVSHTMTGVM